MSNPRVRLLLVAASIVGISLLHYLTPLHRPALHDLLQRLYYLPIILSAYWFGFRGGLGAAIAVSLLYAPHILFQWGDHPTLAPEKYLEMVIFNLVGGVTGLLAQRERERGRQLAETAQVLEESNRQLQRQQEQILASEGQLRRAERLSAIGELAAVLAHEVRNPLGSIRGSAEILRDDFPPGHRKHEFLEILIRETERLNRVVEEFLQLSRPQPVQLEELDLREELATIVTLLSVEAQQRGVRLDLAAGQPGPVPGDRGKLRQVFLNLIMNGLQATPAGGRVSIAAAPREASGELPAGVAVEIRDTGPGIPAEARERIFEPFFTTKEGGTGLGLPVVRRIVEAHGGRIEVTSTTGQGTCFTVLLPAKG